MKLLRYKKALSLALALLLSLSAGASFAMACLHGGDASLACLRICKRGSDLLTQQGRLPSLDAQPCVSASLQEQTSATLVSIPKLQLPQTMFSLAPSPAPVLALKPAQRGAALRAPPTLLQLQAFGPLHLGLAPPQA